MEVISQGKRLHFANEPYLKLPKRRRIVVELEEEDDDRSSESSSQDSTLDFEESNNGSLDLDDEADEESECLTDEDRSSIVDLEGDEADVNKSDYVRTRAKENPISQVETATKTSILKSSILVIILVSILVALVATLLRAPGSEKIQKENPDIKIDFENIDNLRKQYPGLLSPREVKIIKRRLDVMRNEVSILMLLGKSRDSHCNLDPTFCVGQTIANATQYQFGYIDASDPQLNSKEIEKELTDSLSGGKYTVMIDSIESLPGPQVMNLFNFIDKDESGRRRGMLLLVVYTGQGFEQNKPKSNLAEIAERVLVDKWLPFVQKDTLYSVISRMCQSIVKIH